MLLSNLKKFFYKKKYNIKETKNILNNIIEIAYSDFFIKKYKIPNTFQARYEIILIFIFLLYIRFKKDKLSKERMQAIYDYLFEYLDYSLREVGVGDLSVGKKVKTLARIFSFRMKVYEKSISVEFINIKKPIKKFVYSSKIANNNLNNFYNYIKLQHKRITSSSYKVIVNKNFFKKINFYF